MNPEDEYQGQARSIVDELVDGKDGSHERTHEEIIGAALRALGQERDVLSKQFQEYRTEMRVETSTMFRELCKMEKERDELKAKLSVAVEALKFYADPETYIKVDRVDIDYYYSSFDRDKNGDNAREALAKIKGDGK